MKFLVFSDIHGNLEAVKLMLKKAKAEDLVGYVFCGDLAGFGSGQEEIVEIFKGLSNFYSVLGNHDIWYLAAFKNRFLQEELVESGLGKSYGCPSDKVVEFLRQEPAELRFEVCGKRVGVFHNTPGCVMEGRLLPETKVDEKLFEGLDIVFLGHTHRKMQRVIGNTLAINPGSLGYPRLGAKHSWAIFDFETKTTQFFEFDASELEGSLA